MKPFNRAALCGSAIIKGKNDVIKASLFEHAPTVVVLGKENGKHIRVFVSAEGELEWGRSEEHLRKDNVLPQDHAPSLRAAKWKIHPDEAAATFVFYDGPYQIDSCFITGNNQVLSPRAEKERDKNISQIARFAGKADIPIDGISERVIAAVLRREIEKDLRRQLPIPAPGELPLDGTTSADTADSNSSVFISDADLDVGLVVNDIVSSTSPIQTRTDGTKLNLKIPEKRLTPAVMAHRGYRGATIFHNLAMFGKLSAVPLPIRIKYAAMFTEKNDDGDTPIHIAAQQRNFEGVPWEVLDSAVLTEPDRWGRSALHEAASKGFLTFPEAAFGKVSAEMLLEKDESGYDCFDHAREFATRTYRNEPWTKGPVWMPKQFATLLPKDHRTRRSSCFMPHLRKVRPPSIKQEQTPRV